MKTQHIANKGRYGDDDLLHVSKTEIAGLDALARSIYGHPLPRNPETGRKEAFLFLPMLLPALAGAGGLGTGMMGLASSTLGAAALGAGAGTLEAAARGYDGPLQHGIMSGITAGAGSMLGQGIMDAGAQAGMDASVNATAGGLAPTDFLDGAGAGLINTGGPLPTSVGASGGGYTMTQAPIKTLGADPAFVGHEGMLQMEAPTTPLGTQPAQYVNASSAPGPMSGFGDTSGVMPKLEQYGSGLKNIMTDQKAAQAFLDNPNTLKGAIGTVGGMMGQDQLVQAQEAEEAGEAREAESEAEYRRVRGGVDRIYANAGRTSNIGFLPTGNFADGGQVFPMQSGGFVVPKYAVDAAGAGSNEKGLMALKRHVGAKAIRGKGTGTSDSIKATIDGTQPARVSNGEAYVPPEKVKKAGGSRQFYQMLNAAKKSRARRA